jgi:hypothetical protein
MARCQNGLIVKFTFPHLVLCTARKKLLYQITNDDASGCDLTWVYVMGSGFTIYPAIRVVKSAIFPIIVLFQIY